LPGNHFDLIPLLRMVFRVHSKDALIFSAFLEHDLTMIATLSNLKNLNRQQKMGILWDVWFD
jgi:hypothetical protein